MLIFNFLDTAKSESNCVLVLKFYVTNFIDSIFTMELNFLFWKPLSSGINLDDRLKVAHV